jgi:glycosyltransferase involved in cell wall biosynthesis
MKIGFDVSQTGRSKAGCGYFADSLIRNIAAIDSGNEYILYPAVGDLFWDPECARETFHCENRNFQRVAAPKNFDESQALWRRPGPDFEKQLGTPDIFHANNFFCPTELKNALLVYTLYDLSFLEHPEWTTEANRVGCCQGVFRASLYADQIIAISEYSCRHFLQIYPHYPSDRITVIYPASRFGAPAEISRPSCLPLLKPEKFWLSVATLEPRKNHSRLLHAYAKLKSTGRAFPLVLAGGRGWLMEDFQRTLDRLGLNEDVIVTGYVDDAALQWLYQNCFAFVYPSLFEGFGMPVLEAMGLGAPVIASDTTSIPEIAASAGLLVDPTDEASITEAMRKLATGEANRDRLRSASQQSAARFSWTKSAQQALDVYRRVAERGFGERRAETAFAEPSPLANH